MKIFGYTYTAIFLVFSIVQYNDPDGILWIGFYLMLAALSFAASRHKAQSSWLLTASAVLFGGLLYYAPGAYEFVTNQDGISFAQGMQNNFPYIEEAREFGGLTIAFIGMSTLWWNSRKGDH